MLILQTDKVPHKPPSKSKGILEIRNKCFFFTWRLQEPAVHMRSPQKEDLWTVIRSLMYNNDDILFFDHLRQGKAHHPGKSEGDILYDDGIVPSATCCPRHWVRRSQNPSWSVLPNIIKIAWKQLKNTHMNICHTWGPRILCKLWRPVLMTARCRTSQYGPEHGSGSWRG